MVPTLEGEPGYRHRGIAIVPKMEGSDQLTLDEVATWLLQLEATDVEELGRVQQELERLARQMTGKPLIQELLRDAATVLLRIVAGVAPDPAAALAEAGSLIEGIMSALDGAPNGEGKPAPSPAAGEDDGDPATASAPAPSSESEDDFGEDAMIEIPDDVDRDLVTMFLEESREYLENSEAALLVLEANPTDVEACNTVFRAFHTIKGTSAFLGLDAVSELAHWAESLLARVRDGEIQFGGGYADLALRSVDMLKSLVAVVEGIRTGGVQAVPSGYAALMRDLADPDRAAAESSGGFTPSASESTEAEGAEAGGGTRRAAERAADSWVRVRTDRLDGLVDMIGELVIAHSIITENVAKLENGDPTLARDLAHAGKIVRELQDLSVSMRMIPLRATFQRMARVVRDVAHKRGKQVAFVTEAEDTEIDRNMVELLNDPLVHMIRNAVDHGIESPEERVARGKPVVGTVRLSAYHQGGNVVIELSDDGRGLDREKILNKAISRGLIESDRGLSDNDIFNLIFEPGFSTADKVTDVSGRGVGMDVVRRNLEMVRGRIDITSAPGEGSTFSLRLPLTLAITDGMVVRVGTERYILPTISIQMSFRPTAESLSTVAGRGEMVLLRDELLPIVRLHRLFQIPDAVTDPTEALLVIIGAGEQRCALMVDELVAQQQVVAKSLGAGLVQVPGLSGGAILGDGRVGLILDPGQIIALGRRGGGGIDGAPGAQQSVA